MDLRPKLDNPAAACHSPGLNLGNANMSDTTIIISGREYVSPSACSFGDYGGAGSIGLANINALKGRARDQHFYNDFYRASDDESRAYDSDETADIRAQCASDDPPPVFYLTGDYGSETVFLLTTDAENIETLSALESYPSLDDDGVSEIEMHWEEEAWDSWLRMDLERAAFGPDCEPAGEVVAAAYAALEDFDRFDSYRVAMDATNTYAEPEYSGVHVDVDRIAAAYRAEIERRLAT